MLPTRRAFLAALGALAASRAAAPPVADPADLTVAQAAAALRARKLGVVELTRACLARVTRHDKRLNAFITLTAETALAAAARLEAELRAGKDRGPLHGIPVGLKDNIDTKGVKTTGGSAALIDRVPAADAEITRRLVAAGAVIVGKLNMAELAYGFESVTSYTGSVVNPWKAGHVAGGSSGGSAAAVAAGMCLAAIGTDTGGSIRHPAACCNLVGLKPTHGLVSCRGVIPMSWSLDHAGPMTRTARDAALVLRAIAGRDDGDPASLDAPPVDYVAALSEKVSTLRLGKPAGSYYNGLDLEVADAVEAAVKVLAKITAGPPVPDVKLPGGGGGVFTVEWYAGAGKLVGGNRDKCHPRVRGALAPDPKLPAVDYALAVRQLVLSRRAARAAFDAVDVLVTPTTPGLPFLIEDALDSVNGRKPKNPLGPIGRNTSPFNGLGLPAVSVPCGFSRSGLPIGMQLIGPPLSEGRLLALAAAYEALTPWHRRRPKLD
jgi:aspartyl-tRNA(Asn)/glutamyl-tRNA(Gln) amidotransferase subunit A